MSLYRKLVIFMLAVSVLPLTFLGLAFMRWTEEALRERIVEAQRHAVRMEAEAVGEFIGDRVEELRRAAGHFDLSGLGAESLQGAVRLFYRSVPEVAVAVLLDSEGQLLASPAYLSDPNSFPDLVDHPPADETAPDRLRALLPLETALAEGAGAVVLSPVYGAPERGETAMAVALPITWGEHTFVYGAELSLRSVQRRLREVEGLGTVAVVDSDGRFAAHPDPLFAREEAKGPAYLRALASEGAGFSREQTVEGALLAAYAPVPLAGLGWWVVASLPESEAFAPVSRMRKTVLGASGLTIALLLVLGAAFMGRVRSGLGAVTSGVEAFSRGDLDHRIEAPPETELADLARTFNSMGEELAAAREHLMRWNETLQSEVEARTRDLEAAQASLIRAQKLAAVGQLGAGVAHEVNNPLAGILGNVQLLILKKAKKGAGEDDPEIQSLRKVEEAAKRCREVTTTLLRFSQQGSDGRREAVDVNQIVREAASVFASQIEDSMVSLELDLPEPSPRVGGEAGQIAQALLHLLTNAGTALLEKEDGRISIGTSSKGEKAKIVVRDDGCGMEPAVRDRIFEPFFTTKKIWTSLGLGLSVVYRIVEDHGGSVEVDSVVGEGTEVRILLPLAGRDLGPSSG